MDAVGAAKLTLSQVTSDIAEVREGVTSELAPVASVIVVSYGENRGLGECLESLNSQTRRDFEVVIVDNGMSEAARGLVTDSGARWVRMRRNVGCAAGRNAGACHARTPLLLFLDDDAIADPSWAEAHLAAHTRPGVVAAVGRVQPKTATLYNDVAGHYDRGDQPVECYINVEGNSSVATDAFLEVGGFRVFRPIHEGAELSLRLINCYGRGAIIYDPGPVIAHDYANNLGAFVHKRLRSGRATRELTQDMPEVLALMGSYSAPRARRPDAHGPGRRLLRRSVALLGLVLRELGEAGIGGRGR